MRIIIFFNNPRNFEMVLDSSLRKAQRHSIFEQWMKKRRPAVIHRNMKRIFGRKTFTLQAISYQCRRFDRGKGVEDSARSGRPRIEGLEMAIVDESMSAGRVSVREIAKHVPASEDTILRRMCELGAEYRPVRRQPHVLGPVGKRIRIKHADELCTRLRAKNTWPRIVTGDETWLYLRNDNTAEWVFPWDTRGTRTEHCVGDLKIMLSVFWSTSGFHLVRFSSRETSINSAFFIQCLTDLYASLPQTPRGKYFLHVDNAPSHRSKASRKAMQDIGFVILPHPPYSPDLAPSDFYLFGHLKRVISGKHFQSLEELQACISAEISMITTKTLRKVYNEWISRLERCVNNGGEYVHILD